jgi:hypothetical protein
MVMMETLKATNKGWFIEARKKHGCSYRKSSLKGGQGNEKIARNFQS